MLVNNMCSSVLQKIRMNQNKVFYVCSYGGCGSKMLCHYLSHFGTVKHVHSKNPPTELTHIGLNAKWHEWFSTISIPASDLHNYYVIYIYRDPVKAIQSRFGQVEHLSHIQVDPSITLQQVVESKQDLYGIEKFFDNYTINKHNVLRNYKIYCVKYEDLFNNMEKFNKVLNINCSNKSIYPVEKITKRLEFKEEHVLEQIYAKLKQKMAEMPFIAVV